MNMPINEALQMHRKLVAKHGEEAVTMAYTLKFFTHLADAHGGAGYYMNVLAGTISLVVEEKIGLNIDQFAQVLIDVNQANETLCYLLAEPDDLQVNAAVSLGSLKKIIPGGDTSSGGSSQDRPA